MESDITQGHFFSLYSLYSLQSELMMTYGIVIFMLCLSLFLLAPALKNRIIEIKNKNIIKNLGKLSYSNVAISVNLDERVYIDHIVLTVNGIMILKILKYNGIIFCGDNLEQWTQLINKKSFKFPNPQHELNMSISMLGALVEDCNVFGYIVFESNCEFPKGKPEQVLLLSEIRNSLDFLKKKTTEKLEESWQFLKLSESFNSNNKHSQISHLIKNEKLTNRSRLGIVLVVLVIFGLIYRYTEQNWIEILIS